MQQNSAVTGAEGAKLSASDTRPAFSKALRLWTLLERANTPPLRTWLVLLCVAAFSILYFTETCLRASQKNFWHDELVTLSVCRLPDFGAAWTAVVKGTDFNPPFFYVIERATHALFGEGRIAFRLPQIFGFWILCVSLFLFTSRRGGLLAGWVAMLLPRLTQAYFYAYEARPHGIVLGFAGLALLCWQRTEEREKSAWWLLGLAVSLEAACLTHCYAILIAVPFIFAELFRTLRFRKIRSTVWAALILPVCVAVLSYIPLLRAFRANLGADFTEIFPPTFAALPAFYGNLVSPGIALVLLILALFSLERAGVRFQSGITWNTSRLLTRSELVVVIGFLALPALGVALAEIVKGPFFARYFTCAIIGVCIALGVGVGSQERNRASLLIALFLTCLVSKFAAGMVWNDYRGNPAVVIEPSTNIRLNTTPDDPIAVHPLLKLVTDKPLPIVLVRVLDSLYLPHYVPALAPRFYPFTALKDNKIPDEFLRSHPHFYFYGSGNSSLLLLTQLIDDKRADVKFLRFDEFGNFLAELQMPSSKQGTSTAAR